MACAETSIPQTTRLRIDSLTSPDHAGSFSFRPPSQTTVRKFLDVALIYKHTLSYQCMNHVKYSSCLMHKHLNMDDRERHYVTTEDVVESLTVRIQA